jgi:methylmalonyl-CoA mutase N-terminal domain/subunit
MKERFGAKNPQSMMLRFHTQTAGCTLTAQQPENNAVRVGLQALAAVLGGTQSLHTNAMDEALALPTPAAAKLALRTQQIIAHESGVADTVDPLGGSYYVECLTDQLESRVWEYLHRIDAMGGAIAAIEQHFFQREIAAEAYNYQREIESGERIIVGVNKFEDQDEVAPKLAKVDPALEQKQNRRIAELRRTRDSAKVSNVLSILRSQAATATNLMPVLIDAVEARATLGEISNTLRETWGEFEDTP